MPIPPKPGELTELPERLRIPVETIGEEPTTKPGESGNENGLTKPGEFSDIEITALKELAAHYQERRVLIARDRVPMGENLKRPPKFKMSDGETRRNTGIFIKSAIITEALEKQKEAKGALGKSLSNLIELLLWEFIGAPVGMMELPEP